MARLDTIVGCCCRPSSARLPTQLDYTAIKAPISGVVGLRQVDIGNIINAAHSTGIATIAQIEPIATTTSPRISSSAESTIALYK